MTGVPTPTKCLSCPHPDAPVPALQVTEKLSSGSPCKKWVQTKSPSYARARWLSIFSLQGLGYHFSGSFRVWMESNHKKQIKWVDLYNSNFMGLNQLPRLKPPLFPFPSLVCPVPTGKHVCPSTRLRLTNSPFPGHGTIRKAD